MASNCEGNILAHAEFSSTSKMLDYSPLLMSIVCVPVFVYCNYNQPVLLAPLALYILSCSPFLLPIGSNTLLVQTLACVGSTWAFKIGALSMGRGVLRRGLDRGCGPWRFAGVLLLPVIPMEQPPSPAPMATARRTCIRIAAGVAKVTLFSLLLSSTLEPAIAFANRQHSLLRCLLWPCIYYMFGLSLWLEVSGAGDLTDAIASAAFGIHPEPHFNMPILATSLSELWARRWNLTVTSLLRDLVYAPIVEGSLICPSDAGEPTSPDSTGNGDIMPATTDAKPSRATRPRPSRTRKLIGMTATFAFSGVWHEIVFAQIAYSPMTGTTQTTKGLWTIFFLCQAPAIALEGLFLTPSAQSPRHLRVLAENVFFLTIMSLLFMPPMFWELPPLEPGSCATHTLADGTLAANSLVGRLIIQTNKDKAAMPSNFNP